MIGAWCPRFNAANAPLQTRKNVRHRGLFVAGVFLAVLWGLMFLASTEFPMYPPRGGIEVVYAVANQTSHQVFLKLHGLSFPMLDHVTINGSAVKGNLVPILVESGLNYETYAFRYDGPWEGSVLITFYHDGYVFFEQLVDLRAASKNSMEGLNPSPFELLQDYLLCHFNEVRMTIVYGSMIMSPWIAAVVVSVLLLLRRRSKGEPTSRTLKRGAS